MMLPIERGIEMPSRSLSNKRASLIKYPLAEMDIGDSFFVKAKNADEARRRLSGYLTKRGKELSRKFETRIVDGGFRVWRTA